MPTDDLEAAALALRCEWQADGAVADAVELRLAAWRLMPTAAVQRELAFLGGRLTAMGVLMIQGGHGVPGALERALALKAQLRQELVTGVFPIFPDQEPPR